MSHWSDVSFKTILDCKRSTWLFLPEEEYIDIYQLPPEESLMDEENINKDIFEPILPADVCCQIEKPTKWMTMKYLMKIHLIMKYVQLQRED